MDGGYRKCSSQKKQENKQKAQFRCWSRKFQRTSKTMQAITIFLRGPLGFGKPLLKKLYALVTRHGEIKPVLAWKYPLSWPTFTLIGIPKLQ